MGIPNPILYFTSNDSLDHKSPISLFMDPFEYFFLWLGTSMGIPNPILYFPSNHSLTTNVQFHVYGPIRIFFFLWHGNLMGIPNPILYFSSNDSLDHKSPISCLWTNLNNIFLWLWNLMKIPNPILYFPQMTLWTTKVQFPNFLVYELIWIICFYLTCKFDKVYKSDMYFTTNDSLDYKNL